jgi:hypothetical protein
MSHDIINLDFDFQIIIFISYCKFSVYVKLKLLFLLLHLF